MNLQWVRMVSIPPTCITHLNKAISLEFFIQCCYGLLAHRHSFWRTCDTVLIEKVLTYPAIWGMFAWYFLRNKRAMVCRMVMAIRRVVEVMMAATGGYEMGGNKTSRRSDIWEQDEMGAKLENSMALSVCGSVIYPIFIKSISSAYPIALVPVPLLSHSHLCPFMWFLLLLFPFPCS